MNPQSPILRFVKEDSLLNPPNYIQKYIKLDEFIPLWSEQVKELEKKSENEVRNIMKKSGLDITIMEYCVVGESHFFNKDYSNKNFCKKCYDFSYKACDVYRNQKSFENFKLELFTHFLESHTELMIRK